jgi:hypothetical protein
MLRHDLPDGSTHWDWLIERVTGEERVLTFRLESPWPILDDLSADAFRAERLDDHRAMYLEYEGQVSGDRGEVLRVASGSVDWTHLSESRIEVWIRWKQIFANRLPDWCNRLVTRTHEPVRLTGHLGAEDKLGIGALLPLGPRQPFEGQSKIDAQNL